MKRVIGIVVLSHLAVLASGIAVDRHVAAAVELDTRQTPVDRVVTLITALRDQIEADHNKEQKSYDKFACWCEKTFKRKIKDIEDGKEFIKKSEARMLELRGEIGAHEAEVEDLKKQIAANQEAQRDATEVRDKEYADYRDERAESEQCIGALEAAIKVLTGAGAGKGKFLETLQETQLLSVAGDMNRVLAKSRDLHTTSEQDLELVRQFIAHPQDFANSRRAAGTAALQTQNNPFGDYAPQSTQIQGILKGMYDGFTSDLEKDNAEESNKQKDYTEFMDIKKKEEATLKKTLQTHETALAKKKAEYAQTKTDRDNAQVQLEDDEAFFAATKKNCQDQAIAWGDRTRMRTEEMNGVLKAIEILTSKEAQEIFKNSTTTFLQISASRHQSTRSAAASAKARAYSTIRTLAAKYKSMGLANIAVEVKTGGHFDKVQMMIQQMIDILRKEEQEDLDHRDRCEGAENKNKNDADDVDANIQKTNNAIRTNNLAIADKNNKKGLLEGSIRSTKKELKELLDMRNEEEQEFKDSLKHDTEAIDVIQKAIAAISAFYKNHDLKLSLAQQRRAPEYTQDNDTAPELNFGDGNYKRDETGGVVAILKMIIEDTENEMKEARKDDAQAEDEYEQDKNALDKTLNAQERSLTETEKQIADLEAEGADLGAKKTELGETKDGLATEAGNLVNDCSWVKTHFQSRRDARKLEIEGLQSAKAILAGVDAGDWDQVAVASAR